jgi:hypothetical protein
MQTTISQRKPAVTTEEFAVVDVELPDKKPEEKNKNEIKKKKKKQKKEKELAKFTSLNLSSFRSLQFLLPYFWPKDWNIRFRVVFCMVLLLSTKVVTNFALQWN